VWTQFCTNSAVTRTRTDEPRIHRRIETRDKLEENVQAATARQSSENTGADAAAPTTTPIFRIVPLLLWWVSLRRVVHRLALRRWGAVVSLRRRTVALRRISALVVVVMRATGGRRTGVIGAGVMDGGRI
jgi:hypothetical protein